MQTLVLPGSPPPTGSTGGSKSMTSGFATLPHNHGTQTLPPCGRRKHTFGPQTMVVRTGHRRAALGGFPSSCWFGPFCTGSVALPR